MSPAPLRLLLAKIFSGAYGLSKHLPVFLIGTEYVVGGWMALVVVVCGDICGKMCGKIKNCWIRTKYGVVLDMDPVIMIVETKRQKGKKTKRQKDKKAKRQKGQKTKRHKGKNAKMQKGKKTKRQKDKKAKRQKKNTTTKNRGSEGPPHPPQELEQGGHRPLKFAYNFVNLVYM